MLPYDTPQPPSPSTTRSGQPFLRGDGGSVKKRMLEIDPTIEDIDTIAPKGSKRGGALKRYKKAGGTNQAVIDMLSK